jgi:AhpD family alkylhydroperoxidase
MQYVHNGAGKASPYDPRMTEPARLDLFRSWPAGYQAMQAMEAAVRQSGFDLTIFELVKTRASQINQCAYCIDMHTKDARANGETEQRLYALSAWRETPFFTERERAALALTEAVTLVAETHVPDDVVEDAQKHFDEAELTQLVFAITTINAWNRLAITARLPVGGYQARGHE